MNSLDSHIKKPNTVNNHSTEQNTLENVLILQGGGSLGAFGCGVYKALVKNNINLDITAGTSIGGINAAIIAGSKREEHTDQLLEDFWMELSEGFVDMDNLSLFSTWNKFLEQMQPFSKYPYYYPHLPPLSPPEEREIKENHSSNKDKQEVKIKQLKSFYSSAIFGNSKMFKPRWLSGYALTDPEYFNSHKWTYLYDHLPIAKTLERYVDYDKLRPTNGNSNVRLILTAVNVLNARPLTFDSFKVLCRLTQTI